jgi:hypothetical protein
MRCSLAFKSPSGVSFRRINGKDPSSPGVSNVIGDGTNMLIYDDHCVKIVEDIEPWKVEPGTPEWVGDPRV